MVDVAKLLGELKFGPVMITYKHWRKETELRIVATLQESITETKLTQDPLSSVIVVYDVVAGIWEDIRVDTIISYNPIEKPEG